MQEVITYNTLFCGRVSRRAVFCVVIAAVVCMMFVGGAYGAEFSVSNEDELRAVVASANGNGEDDVIIIAESFDVSGDTLTIYNGKITIMNAEGIDTVISRPRGAWGLPTTYNSLFSVTAGGELELSSSTTGTLTFNGNDNWQTSNGGAVYVDGGSLTMNNGVTITKFGWLGSDYAGVGGIYVNRGTFTMTGGTISYCDGNQGGGVYVAADGRFEMSGGLITENGHDEKWYLSETYGGGVLVEEGGDFFMSGDAQVTGNYGSPDIAGVVKNPETGELEERVSYTVHHSLEQADSSYKIVSTQTVADGIVGQSATVTPREFPGYAPQQPSYSLPLKNDVTQNVITIYYDYASSVTIYIPTSLYLNTETATGVKGDLTIRAEKLWLTETDVVSVSLAEENDFLLVYSFMGVEYPDITLPYTVKNGETTLAEGSEIATYSMESIEGWADLKTSLILGDSTKADVLQETVGMTLTAYMDTKARYVGTYTDALTFTIRFPGEVDLTVEPARGA